MNKKTKIKPKIGVEEKLLVNKRKVSEYKRTSPEIKQKFINYMFTCTSEIKGMNATKSSERLIELFKVKYGIEMSKSWVQSLFRYELKRTLHPDGRTEYTTNGKISFDQLLSKKKK